ncbi:MAG: L-aspartate oxidase, partial [Solirubrobacteraceae bacterium]
AAAWRAGAELADVEFMQFHPTSLAVPGNPLVSEAVRGEGAVLLDASGRRFMLDVHPDGELAPRDVVARGIAAAMARQGGAPVLLDATALGRALLEDRFPGISRMTAAHGFDWTMEPVPVTPAAHYWMGGIRTDIDGRTSLPGLFAVGEAACTGVHGANRLASNSLLESLVFASRVADALDMDAPPVAAGRPSITLQPVGPAAAIGEPFTRQRLQELMWHDVGLERSAAGLRSAAETLAGWGGRGDTVAEAEDANLLDLARVIVAAALRREESRGAHARADHPATSDGFEYSMLWTHPVPARTPAVAR